MKNKSKILCLIIYLILIFNISFLIYKIKKIKEIDQKRKIELQVNINNLNSKIEMLLYNQEKQILYDNKKINDKLLVISTNNQKKLLIDLLTDNKLIFFMPSKACSPCYENLFIQFSIIQTYIGKENFIMLVPIERIRSYLQLFNDNNININLYAYNDKQLNLNVNNNLTPYFLITDNTMLIKHLYIPDINSIDISKNYLITISKKYFINDNALYY